MFPFLQDLSETHSAKSNQSVLLSQLKQTEGARTPDSLLQFSAQLKSLLDNKELTQWHEVFDDMPAEVRFLPFELDMDSLDKEDAFNQLSDWFARQGVASELAWLPREQKAAGEPLLQTAGVDINAGSEVVLNPETEEGDDKKSAGLLVPLKTESSTIEAGRVAKTPVADSSLLGKSLSQITEDRANSGLNTDELDAAELEDAESVLMAALTPNNESSIKQAVAQNSGLASGNQNFGMRFASNVNNANNAGMLNGQAGKAPSVASSVNGAAQTSVFSSVINALQGGQGASVEGLASKVDGYFSPAPASAQMGAPFTQWMMREKMSLEQQQMLRDSDLKAKVAKEGELTMGQEKESPLSSERKTSSPPSLASISYPMRHPQWAQAVGKRIVFMANQQMQQAQISLSPEKLGPIQLRLQLDRDQMVSVSMTAQHGATKEALEQAIPRLKEMLAEAGIKYSDVLVEDEETFNRQQEDRQTESHAGGADEQQDSDDAEPLKVQQSHDNMIDFYA